MTIAGSWWVKALNPDGVRVRSYPHTIVSYPLADIVETVREKSDYDDDDYQNEEESGDDETDTDSDSD